MLTPYPEIETYRLTQRYTTRRGKPAATVLATSARYVDGEYFYNHGVMGNESGLFATTRTDDYGEGGPKVSKMGRGGAGRRCV
jgi:hypothetical protein